MDSIQAQLANLRLQEEKTPEPKLKLPDSYDGSRSQFRGFLNQCRLYLSMKPRTYASHRAKVGLIISLLTGPALSWATPILEREGKQGDPDEPADIDLMENYPKFVDEFTRMFDDPNRARSAEMQLLRLRQGKRSATVYTSEFQRVSQDTDWNNAALQSQFRLGLAEEVKDELARVDPPKSLRELTQLAIRIDNRLHERRLEKLQVRNPNQVMRERFLEQANVLLPRRNTPVTMNTAGQGPEPMQLDNTRRLTPEEKARRQKEGLCLYCGLSGHLVARCPTKPAPRIQATVRTEEPAEVSGNDDAQE